MSIKKEEITPFYKETESIESLPRVQNRSLDHNNSSQDNDDDPYTLSRYHQKKKSNFILKNSQKLENLKSSSYMELKNARNS